MDFSEIAARYSTPETEVQKSVELARRSLVPRTRSFIVHEQGRQYKMQVTRDGVGPLTTAVGDFHLFTFSIDDEWQKYSVLVMATLDDNFNPVFKRPEALVLRIDSGCETGQLFGDRTCECREQLHLCMRQIFEVGEGMVINIPRQDGRGLGLPFKLATLRIQADLGVHTVEASALLDPDGSRDTRTYAGVIAILNYLNIPKMTQIHLASNNPKKSLVFSENGYTVADLTPVIIAPTEFTRHHLQAKQKEFGHINLIPDVAMSGPRVTAPPWAERLMSAIEAVDSRICCGIDPDITKMPAVFDDIELSEQRVEAFLHEVLIMTAPHVAAYKIQKAFFDAFDNGRQLLRRTIQNVRNAAPHAAVIVDCKVGDIDNTMAAYLSTLFGSLGADAIVINPYMGTDVWAQFRKYPDKAGLVLVRTSNPGSGIIQEVETVDGLPLWRHVLGVVLSEWRTGNNLIPVVSSNSALPSDVVRELRDAAIPIFVAGMGAQGGALSNCSGLLRKETPILFNSSRSLLYPYERASVDWREAMLNAVLALRGEINAALE